MSLYPEHEQLASVYHANDSDTTKKTAYSTTPAFTIKMFIQRRNEDTTQLLGEELGEYVANVNGEYTNAGNIRRGDKVVWSGSTYQVVNKPRYNVNFNRYKLVLKSQ